MNSLSLSQLVQGSKFTSDIYLDPNFLLLSSSVPVSSSLIKALAEWNFSEIFQDTEKKQIPVPKSSDTAEKTEAKSDNNSNTKDSNVKTEKTKASFEEISNLATEFSDKEKSIQSGTMNKELLQAIKDADDFAKQNPGTINDKSHLELVQKAYNECFRYIEKIYTHYATHKEFDIKEIAQSVVAMCGYIKANKSYVLRITPSLNIENKEFLINHSLRSTVLAITIAQQIKMPLPQMTELGIASILHEIGMIRLPPQLYMKEKRLNPQEKAKVNQHPIFSYKITEEAKFSQAIQYAVLDHHEKENGTGYPRKINGKKISLYGKIIAVACTYEAITAPRHYKEAKSTYDAMVEMLKNEQRAFDDVIIKALLYSLSLYPIGAYVYLSNGKVAQVVDITPGAPRNPIVQILGDKLPNGSPKNVQSNDAEYKIMRVLNKAETKAVLQRLGK